MADVTGESYFHDGGVLLISQIKISELRGFLSEESARIQREFEASGDGRAAVAHRTRLVEEILARLWSEIVSPDAAKPSNFALVATGGFGRGWLFPFSDIDLFFFSATGMPRKLSKIPFAAFPRNCGTCA